MDGSMEVLKTCRALGFAGTLMRRLLEKYMLDMPVAYMDVLKTCSTNSQMGDGCGLRRWLGRIVVQLSFSRRARPSTSAAPSAYGSAASSLDGFSGRRRSAAVIAFPVHVLATGMDVLCAATCRTMQFFVKKMRLSCTVWAARSELCAALKCAKKCDALFL